MKQKNGVKNFWWAMIKKILKFALISLAIYLLLWWAITNPNSAKKVKDNIDDTIEVVTDRVKEAADNLTDD